ncbi:hypothetical protein PROFUN_03713 [Planoprotostelium fungivorum]|uniref:Uncharacterized protein n=1 Tax=Planoprotostelium fungivorum TaxID=1890364 RepID=A0A2P6NDH9_9EUKA|nr:hypothetical protein PROFUN_03713 [Planoprotostelium fungivorum]
MQDCVEAKEMGTSMFVMDAQMIAYFQEDKGSSLEPEAESSGELCSIVVDLASLKIHFKKFIPDGYSEAPKMVQLSPANLMKDKNGLHILEESMLYHQQASKEGDWTRCKRQNQKKD